jgi:hypothetical protein
MRHGDSKASEAYYGVNCSGCRPGSADRRRLVWLIANWCTRNKKCFTCQFKQHFRRTRREVFPLLSRVQNIGDDLGENGRTPEWYRANHRTPWVAASHSGSEFKLWPHQSLRNSALTIPVAVAELGSFSRGKIPFR